MTGFEKICKVSDIPVNSMKGFTIGDKQILVANVGDKYYVIDAICSHTFGYLPMGKLEDKVVTCPVHHAQFDVASGKVIKNINRLIKMATKSEATDLDTYELKIEDGYIMVNTQRIEKKRRKYESA